MFERKPVKIAFENAGERRNITIGKVKGSDDRVSVSLEIPEFVNAVYLAGQPDQAFAFADPQYSDIVFVAHVSDKIGVNLETRIYPLIGKNDKIEGFAPYFDAPYFDMDEERTGNFYRSQRLEALNKLRQAGL